MNAAAVIAAAATVSLVVSMAPPAVASGNNSARFDKPRDGFMSRWTMLRSSSPARAGLDPAPIATALAALDAGTKPVGTAKPLFPGAVTLIAHDGKVVTKAATGLARKYADGQGTELPADQQIPMRTDTIFDMASVSKLFTSILVMQQVEAGRLDLDAPMASYIPEFATNGKGAIPVRQLLTHTSGLPSWKALWRLFPDRRSRIQGALTTELKWQPGTVYEYSDLNLIALGELTERLSGKSLDQQLRDGITRPLGMVDTSFNPDPSKLHRIAPTEFQAAPPRGMVWGSVHDENAWSMEGLAGHAGVFSTADDLAKLAQALLNGGSYHHRRILSEDTVEAMITNYNQAFPGKDHGLGFDLNQRGYMNALAGPRTAGHTGYTGTSMVIDFDSRTFLILLTNRVHPDRNWSVMQPIRRTVALGVALSLAVQPRHGRDAWFSGTANATSATLTTPALRVPSAGGRVGFDLFVDTENSDKLFLERSTDGGTTWTPVPFQVRDRDDTVTETDGSFSRSGVRRWAEARAVLPAGDQVLRWRYTTDPDWSGRGVYVDGVRVFGGQRLLLDGERKPESFTTTGWRLSRR